MHIRSVAACLALVALVACGDDDDDGSSTATPTAATSTTAAAGPTSFTVPAPTTSAAPDSTPVTSEAPDCRGTATIPHLDLQYQALPGVDPNLTSLDLYEPERPEACGPAPIVVFVHGGGFSIGDKANKAQDKARLFNDEGWLFVSVNYRLSPRPSALDDPDRVMFPDQNEDIAAALGWLEMHAAEHGGDPSKLMLMGHSAGAYLVAIQATNASFNEAAGVPAGHVLCTVPLDTSAFRIDEAVGAGAAGSEIYRNAFGDDPQTWAAASPYDVATLDPPTGAFLVVSRGAGRVEANQRFVDHLVDLDVDASLLDAGTLTHAEVNAAVGQPGDTIVTPPLIAFLRTCATD